MAHDFNNLLMAVLSNLELLSKNVLDDPKTARLISGALQGAKRGAALTQRLLAFARRQDLNVEPTNLVDLLRGMTDLIERSIGSHIELRIELPDTLPLALVDANQIELAVLNLVLNARDAMPDGGTLRIKADQTESAGSEIPNGQLRAAGRCRHRSRHGCRDLEQGDGAFFSTKELGKGTGLGLSMVQGLAVQLNGALRLESRWGTERAQNCGCRQPIWPPRKPFRSRMRRFVRQSQKMTVLLVDDDALIAMTTVDMLEDLGFKVIEANSGNRALEIIRNGSAVDLLITDYSMPRMNGAQLASAVKQVRPELPILLATGYAELPPHSGVALPRIGKPYRQAQLAEEIKIYPGNLSADFRTDERHVPARVQSSKCPLLCRFLDAGVTSGAARSGGRRPKSAKARSRGEVWAAGGGRRPALWGFDFHAGYGGGRGAGARRCLEARNRDRGGGVERINGRSAR